MGAVLGCCEVEGILSLKTLQDELTGIKLQMRAAPEVWVTVVSMEIKEGRNVKFNPQSFSLRALSLETLVEVTGTKVELAALASEKSAESAVAKLKLDSAKSSGLAAKAKGMVHMAGTVLGGGSTPRGGSSSTRSQTVEVTVDMMKTLEEEVVVVKVQDIKTDVGLINKLFSMDVCKKFIEDAISKKVSEMISRSVKRKHEEVFNRVGLSPGLELLPGLSPQSPGQSSGVSSAPSPRPSST